MPTTGETGYVFVSLICRGSTSPGKLNQFKIILSVVSRACSLEAFGRQSAIRARPGGTIITIFKLS